MPLPHPFDPAPFFASYGIYSPHARAALTDTELVITVSGKTVRRLPVDDLAIDELERLGDVLNWQRHTPSSEI